MKNLLIILIASLPLISYGQGTSKKVLKKASKELCECMDLLDADPMGAATCMLEFSKNEKYENIDAEQFLTTMKKVCPESAQRFEELANSSSSSSEDIVNTAAEELCGCMDKFDENPMDAVNCMTVFAEKEEYQSIGQEGFMKAMYKSCPEGAKKFEELSKLGE